MAKRAERKIKRNLPKDVSPEERPSSGETQPSQTLLQKDFNLDENFENKMFKSNRKPTYEHKQDLEIFEDLDKLMYEEASNATNQELDDLEKDYLKGKFS